MKYTSSQALTAIESLINGKFDNPELQKLGPLLPDTLEDIARILNFVKPPIRGTATFLFHLQRL